MTLFRNTNSFLSIFPVLTRMILDSAEDRPVQHPQIK